MSLGAQKDYEYGLPAIQNIEDNGFVFADRWYDLMHLDHLNCGVQRLKVKLSHAICVHHMTKKECNSSFQNVADSADMTWCTWIVVCRVKTGPAGQNSHTEVELSSGLLPLPSTSKIFRSRIGNRGQFVNGHLLIQITQVDAKRLGKNWRIVLQEICVMG